MHSHPYQTYHRASLSATQFDFRQPENILLNIFISALRLIYFSIRLLLLLVGLKCIHKQFGSATWPQVLYSENVSQVRKLSVLAVKMIKPLTTFTVTYLKGT
uniref:Uncharacterized protein n=1 Tax=Glossina brevipalpis TaxID=37001 RepID=A0A1A9WUT2_9MUSC